jgi:quinol monooxygenase YgiN
MITMLRNPLSWFLIVCLAAPVTGSEVAARGPSEPVVRISQGFFAAGLLPEVQAKLDASRAALDPALRALPGLLHYYVAIDPVSSSIVNVSVWDSLEAAAQMNDLPAMRAQRDVFVDLGVEFQPVRNYIGLWSVAP